MNRPGSAAREPASRPSEPAGDGEGALQVTGHSERMRAMADLSDGVAHEFSELMTAVMGNADLALLDVEEPKACREHLRAVLRAAMRARDLSNQLRAYGGRQPCQFAAENLTDLMRRVEPLVRKVLSPDTGLTIDVPPRPLRANVDRSQLNQALLALMVRARGVLPQGKGRVTVELTERFIDDYQAKCLAMDPGRVASITVNDTGTPVSPEDIERIFEPFGTGNRARGGTGLELATVHGTIRRHCGAVTAASGRGRGTTFTILLPALTVEEEDEIGDATDETVTPLPRLSVPEIRRVAVVDDEVIVRNTLVAILRAYDIEAIVPRDAEEALRMLTAMSPRVDALITDVRMPGMSGPELARALRAVHPDLPVLLVSGHTHVGIDQVWAGAHAVGFLPKPFTPNQLLAALRALMIVPRNRR